ncbi:MAG: protein kinase, partial [Burkholderiales bacterium PBB5]
DNQVDSLPEALGACAPLQKLMLAGNRLHRLPDSLARCQQLELVRLAANRFETIADALPHGLLALPRLAWLAHAGNPFAAALDRQAAAGATAMPIDWSTLQLQGLLGEGASGLIHAATWQTGTAAARLVAVKLFKGAVTSDGLPRSEMAASMAAGDHAHLVGVLGRLTGHPDGTAGLVLRRIPPGHANLAGPPSLDSCSRDVYAPGLRLGAAPAQAIAHGMQAALDHLHLQGLAHGDLYAHNILADARGQALLGDLGAASFLPVNDPVRRAALQRIDRRALAVLLAELAGLCDEPVTALQLQADARRLQA